MGNYDQQVVFIPVPLSEFENRMEERFIKAFSKASKIHLEIADGEKEDWLTIAQLAAKWQCSKPTIHKQMKLGLPFEKLGRKTLFRRGDVDNYFKQK